MELLPGIFIKLEVKLLLAADLFKFFELSGLEALFYIPQKPLEIRVRLILLSRSTILKDCRG